MGNSLLTILLLDCSLLAFLIGYIFGLTILGRNRRNYSYLGSFDKINNYTNEQFASKFKPIIYQKDEFAPFPYKIVYEIIDQPKRYIIIYRIFWRNEISPNKFFHYLYVFFRLLYYGSIHDIEFLEVVVNKKNLTLEEFHFETNSNASKRKSKTHKYVILKKIQKEFICQIEGESKPINFSFLENQQIQLYVVSWNHLFIISKSLEGQKFDLPLSYLDEKQYRKYKMCRRSTGEISTRYFGLANQFASLTIALLIGFFPLLIYFLI